MVELSTHDAMVVGSMPHGGPNKLFPVPAKAPQLVLQRSLYVLSCLCAYKRSLAANQSNSCSDGSRIPFTDWSFIFDAI